MKSRTTRRFRRAFEALPADIRRRATEAYELFERDPGHPSLRFRRVDPPEPVYSVRVTRNIRALGTLEGGDIVWFWIGSHDDYGRLIRRQ